MILTGKSQSEIAFDTTSMEAKKFLKMSLVLSKTSACIIVSTFNTFSWYKILWLWLKIGSYGDFIL